MRKLLNLMLITTAHVFGLKTKNNQNEQKPNTTFPSLSAEVVAMATKIGETCLANPICVAGATVTVATVGGVAWYSFENGKETDYKKHEEKIHEVFYGPGKHCEHLRFLSLEEKWFNTRIANSWKIPVCNIELPLFNTHVNKCRLIREKTIVPLFNETLASCENGNDAEKSKASLFKAMTP